MRMKKIFALTLVGLLVVPTMVFSAMSSTNYYIYADTIDVGGSFGTSTSYSLQDSVGGVSLGISTSTSYEVLGGYQSMEKGSLSFSLSGNSIDFATPAAATLVSSTIVATINTDSNTGYTLSISNVSGTALSSVTDGAVDGVGSAEEYGLAVSGTHASFVNDQAISNSLLLSSFSSAVVSDQTSLVFKAIRSASSVAGTYNQTVTLIASANI